MKVCMFKCGMAVDDVRIWQTRLLRMRSGVAGAPLPLPANGAR
jgi:hypothetical protein